MSIQSSDGAHTIIQVTPATPILKNAPENALDALLDELQTFSKPVPGRRSFDVPMALSATPPSDKKPGM